MYLKNVVRNDLSAVISLVNRARPDLVTLHYRNLPDWPLINEYGPTEATFGLLRIGASAAIVKRKTSRLGVRSAEHAGLRIGFWA